MSFQMILTMFLVSCIQFSQSLPLPEPQPIPNGHNNQNPTDDHENFMLKNGVTQEEIKEFHRLRKRKRVINCKTTRTYCSTMFKSYFRRLRHSSWWWNGTARSGTYIGTYCRKFKVLELACIRKFPPMDRRTQTIWHRLSHNHHPANSCLPRQQSSFSISFLSLSIKLK